MQWTVIFSLWITVAYLVLGIWMFVKYYRALDRIGKELRRISQVLQDRLPGSNPGSPTRHTIDSQLPL